MTVNRRKKNSRQRGSWTHGWGQGRSKHRGAGHRGGRGNAGTGKRCKSRKMSALKAGNVLGKFGFRPKRVLVKSSILNLSFLESHKDSWLAVGKINQEGDLFVFDASKAGYDKVLGSGFVSSKWRVTAKIFSKRAEEKLSAVGGQAITL